MSPVSRVNAYLVPGTIIVFGIAALIRGFSLPEYSVPNGRDLLYNSSWQESDYQKWVALREKIVTRHFFYCDLGYAITALGLSVGAIFIWQKVRTMSDLRDIITPTSHRQFYIFAAIVWLSFVPAQLVFLTYIDAREDPPFVDNMAIPFESGLTLLLGAVGLPVILFGVWLVTRGKSLPVPLWPGPTPEPTRLLTLAIWIALLLAALVTVNGIRIEPPIIPSCVFTVYLLLCGRAISISQVRTNPARGFEVVRNVGTRNGYDESQTP